MRAVRCDMARNSKREENPVQEAGRACPRRRRERWVTETELTKMQNKQTRPPVCAGLYWVPVPRADSGLVARIVVWTRSGESAAANCVRVQARVQVPRIPLHRAVGHLGRSRPITAPGRPVFRPGFYQDLDKLYRVTTCANTGDVIE